MCRSFSDPQLTKILFRKVVIRKGVICDAGSVYLDKCGAHAVLGEYYVGLGGLAGQQPTHPFCTFTGLNFPGVQAIEGCMRTSLQPGTFKIRLRFAYYRHNLLYVATFFSHSCLIFQTLSNQTCQLLS